MSTVCSQSVLKRPYLARIGRPDIFVVCEQTCACFKKWTKSCDKRLARLISYIHHTSEYRQYGYVANTAKQCRLGLFQDSDFAGDLEDSKSTSGGTLCVFGSHTFVPISWMCKKQTSVSHSSTEAEIISLDAGSRMDGIPALTLWDLVLKYFIPYRTEQMDPRESNGETRRQLSSQTCITPCIARSPRNSMSTVEHARDRNLSRTLVATSRTSRLHQAAYARHATDAGSLCSIDSVSTSWSSP